MRVSQAIYTYVFARILEKCMLNFIRYCLRYLSIRLINQIHLQIVKECMVRNNFMGVPIFSTGEPLLDFFYTLFNGIAEVPLFSSPITGIFDPRRSIPGFTKSRCNDGPVWTHWSRYGYIVRGRLRAGYFRTFRLQFYTNGYGVLVWTFC